MTIEALTAQVRSTLRRLGPAAPLAVAVTTVPPIGTVTLTLVATLTHLPQWMREHHSPAVVYYVLAFWVLGICCLPTYAYSVLGGWCFGFWTALVATTLAYGGACAITFAISRRLGRGRLNPLIDEYPKLVAVRRVMLEASSARSTFVIALLRIVPVSPFAITNFVLGAVGVGWGPYMVGSAVGVIPRTAIVVWVASGLAELPLTNSWGLYVFAGLSALAIAALVVSSIYARVELDRQLAAGPLTPTPATPTGASPGAARCPPPS